MWNLSYFCANFYYLCYAEGWVLKMDQLFILKVFFILLLIIVAYAVYYAIKKLNKLQTVPKNKSVALEEVVTLIPFLSLQDRIFLFQTLIGGEINCLLRVNNQTIFFQGISKRAIKTETEENVEENLAEYVG